MWRMAVRPYVLIETVRAEVSCFCGLGGLRIRFMVRNAEVLRCMWRANGSRYGRTYGLVSEMRHNGVSEALSCRDRWHCGSRA